MVQNILCSILRINPFSFPEGIHVLEHLDRLVEIFNVCWPMYAAMPAVLKESIIRAYENCGWNLKQSYNPMQLYPSFKDVLHELKNVANFSEYSSVLLSKSSLIIDFSSSSQPVSTER